MANLTKIEVTQWRLNVAILAFQTKVEAEPGDKDLSDIYFLLQEANKDLKEAMEEPQNGRN